MRTVAVAVAAVISLTGVGAGLGVGVAHARPRPRAAPTGPVEIKPPKVRGPIERRVVESVLRRHRAHLEYCYEKALLRNPSLAGRLRARFRILTTGTTDGGVAGVDNELENCTARIVRRMRFPSGAAETEVTVDLVLRAPPVPRPPRAKPATLRDLLTGPCIGCGLSGCCPCPCAPLAPGTIGPGLGGHGPGTGGHDPGKGG